MNVILTEDHDTLGMKGDVVDVKPGFGRNYLIPRQMAVLATPSNVKRYEEERRQAAHKIEAAKEQAEALAKRIDGTELLIPTTVGEEGRLFGSITTAQVAEELAAKGFDVDRRKITMDDIRSTGVYTATVRVYQDLDAEVKVTVTAEESSV